MTSTLLSTGRPARIGSLATRPRKRPSGRRPLRVGRQLGMWVIAVFYSVPIYLLVVISLKTPTQIAQSPFALPIPPRWDNFTAAWQRSSGSAAPTLGQSIVNSAILTGTSVVLVVAIGAAAGYYLGRSQSRFANRLFLGTVALITVPIQLVIIPVYTVMEELSVTGDLIAAAFFYTGFLTPFAVFLVTGFVRALPQDFEEASRLDGCGQLQTFVHVVIPLLRPILSTVAILTAIAVWNDFFGQLVFLLGSGNETLPLTVYTFASQYASRYDLLSAGLVIATLPLAGSYLLLQRRIVEGFATGIRG